MIRWRSAHDNTLGIALKVGAALGFTLMYACIKLAGAVPAGQAIFFRAFFALLTLLAVVALAGNVRRIAATNRLGQHALRGTIGACSMFCNFTAVKMLPLADMTAFTFVMPIFAVILAAVVLKEKVGPWRSGAVLVGFGGILLMLQPQGGVLAIVARGFSTGAAMALGGALLSAVVVIFIRRMSATEKSETIVFYFMAMSSVVGAASMLWVRVPLGPAAMCWLALSGVTGGLGQICMTFCYRYAEPSLLAPFDYTAMLWAVGLGFFVFGDVPQLLVLAGAALVGAAGVFIAAREHRMARARTSGVKIV
jgi:drug/metabolite transporter (DMT)-like permease